MTTQVPIWLLAVVIVRVTGSINVCCPGSVLLSNYSTPTCKNNKTLDWVCNNGVELWQLDKEMPDEQYTIDSTDEYLEYKGLEFEPAAYCVSMMAVENDSEHEIALICIEKPPEDDTLSIPIIVIFAAVEIATVVFLLIIILLYLALPELRDIQGKCILHFLINYTILFLIIDTIHRPNPLSCVIKAYSLYFFSISSWCWLCMSSFNIWKASIVKNLEDSRTYFMYLLYGYGIPVTMLFLIILSQLLPDTRMKPNFDNYNCWFGDHITRWWYYHLPITVLLLGTFFFFIDTSRRLRVTHHSRINIHRKKALRTRCCLYLKLSIIVGLTWILAIICNEFFPNVEALIFITDILNCLQGFLIFITLIATRNKVLKVIAKRKPFGWNFFPNSWLTAVDKENEEENRNRYHHTSFNETEYTEIHMKTLNSYI